MSSGHDAHDEHHDFDDAPVHELPADEPRTPGWIPALGLGLFVVALVFWMARGGSDAAAVTPEGARSATVQAAAPPAPPPPQQPMVRPVPAAPGAPTGSTTARQMTPEQAKELQKRIEELKARRGQNPTPAAAPGR
jgi:hypothetical protein